MPDNPIEALQRDILGPRYKDKRALLTLEHEAEQRAFYARSWVVGPIIVTGGLIYDFEAPNA